MMIQKRAVAALALALCCATMVPAQQADPVKVLTSTVRVAKNDVVPLAEAMPENLYTFAPSAAIFAKSQTTEFKGVRTFGQQVAHIAASNYEFLEDMGIKTGKDIAAVEKMVAKAEAVKELKESYAMVDKMIAETTAANAFEGLGPKKTATRVATAASIAWHSMDHYGQMVEYGRMNGIVPPGSR